MNALLQQLHSLRDQIERASVPAPRKPWPISSTPDFANGVLMSDGTIQTFRSYGRAMSFIEHNPAPTAREQITASHYEEMEAEYGPLARDPDFDERFEPEDDND